MSILRSINEGFERRYGKLIDDRKSKEVKEKELTEAPIYGLEAQYDSRRSFGGKAQVETDNAGTETLYSYDTPVVKIVKGKVTLLPKWDSSVTTLRHVKEFLKQHDLKAESKEQIAKDYGARVAESCKKGVKECDEKNRKGAIVRRPAMKEACRKDRKSIKEYKDMGQDLGEYQKWVDYDMKRYHKISDKTMDKIKEAGLTVVKDQYGDYEVIAHEPVRECDDKEAKRRAIVKEAIDRTRAKRLQEAKKRTVAKEPVRESCKKGKKPVKEGKSIDFKKLHQNSVSKESCKVHKNKTLIKEDAEEFGDKLAQLLLRLKMSDIIADVIRKGSNAFKSKKDLAYFITSTKLSDYQLGFIISSMVELIKPRLYNNEEFATELGLDINEWNELVSDGTDALLEFISDEDYDAIIDKIENDFRHESDGGPYRYVKSFLEKSVRGVPELKYSSADEVVRQLSKASDDDLFLIRVGVWNTPELVSKKEFAERAPGLLKKEYGIEVPVYHGKNRYGDTVWYIDTVANSDMH